jgi:hypothetical protein
MVVKKKAKSKVKAPFVWDDVEMWTFPDVFEMAQLVEDENEASEFFEAYAAACDSEEHASHSLGYMARLISDEEEREAFCELFEVEPQIEPVQVFKSRRAEQ